MNKYDEETSYFAKIFIKEYQDFFQQILNEEDSPKENFCEEVKEEEDLKNNDPKVN